MNYSGLRTLQSTAVVLAALFTIGAKSELHDLIVYGQGFIFSVKEPPGWKGDTDNAQKFSSNLILYPESSSIEHAPAIIRIVIVDKTDERIGLDLDADMKGYRARFPNIRFATLHVTHPAYASVAKVFYLPGNFYEYVTYINPGPSRKLMFSVAMNIHGRQANGAEMTAYRRCIASLDMLSR